MVPEGHNPPFPRGTERSPGDVRHRGSRGRAALSVSSAPWHQAKPPSLTQPFTKATKALRRPQTSTPSPSPAPSAPSRRHAGGWRLTERQPRLPQVEVDTEVCLEAQVLQGDVRTRFPFEFCVFHVTVEDPCGDKQRVVTFAPQSGGRDVGRLCPTPPTPTTARQKAPGRPPRQRSSCKAHLREGEEKGGGREKVPTARSP